MIPFEFIADSHASLPGAAARRVFDRHLPNLRKGFGNGCLCYTLGMSTFIRGIAILFFDLRWVALAFGALTLFWLGLHLRRLGDPTTPHRPGGH